MAEPIQETRQVTDLVPLAVNALTGHVETNVESTFERIALDFINASILCGWTPRFTAERLAHLLRMIAVVQEAPPVARAITPDDVDWSGKTEKCPACGATFRPLTPTAQAAVGYAVTSASQLTTLKGAEAIRRRLDEVEARLGALEPEHVTGGQLEALEEADRELDRKIDRVEQALERKIGNVEDEVGEVKRSVDHLERGR